MKAAPSTRRLSSRPSAGETTAEARAFLSLLKSYAPTPLTPPAIRSLADLACPLPLVQVLSTIDDKVFSLKTIKPPPKSGKEDSDWVGNLNALRRLHRALVAYAGGSEGQEWAKLRLDLASVAKGDQGEILKFLRVCFAIAISVTPGNELLIGKITTLNHDDQQALMVALEPYLPKVPMSSSPTHGGQAVDPILPRDVDRELMQGEREQLRADNEALEAALGKLSREHEDLQAQLEEARANLHASAGSTDSRSPDAAAALLHEVDRLKAELRQSEDNLTEADTALDRQTKAVEGMTKRIDELNTQVKENIKLRDQLDEFKHASDRLSKSEAANKKLSKKLEEAADMRRLLKAAEDENARLVDRNAEMEDELRKGAGTRALADSCKIQLAELEARDRERQKEMTDLRFALEQAQSRLQSAEAELATQQDEVELTRERIQELEIGGSPAVGRDGHGRMRSASEDADGVAALEDALDGRTRTDLKLQVRRLQGELDAARRPDEDSRIIVLENLLADAKSQKERYEREFLDEHKALLSLKAELEKIRSGRGGNSAEEAQSLRLRLADAVGELQTLKMSHAELQVSNEQAQRNLASARADLKLVNMDQLDILHSLRASVGEEKAELESDVRRAQDKVKQLEEKGRMQMDQINSLLLDKVGLQGEGIAKREAQLERERAFGDMRVSLAGKDLPEDVKTRLLDLQDEKMALSAEVKKLSTKLRASEEHVQKAKTFIRDQDRMLKEAQKAREANGNGDFVEAQQLYEKTIADLKADVKRRKENLKELDARYRHEFQLVFSAYQDIGTKLQREHIRGERRDVQPSSWLAQQRKKHNVGLQRQ